MSRGLDETEAYSLIVNGFIEPITKAGDNGISLINPLLALEEREDHHHERTVCGKWQWTQ